MSEKDGVTELYHGTSELADVLEPRKALGLRKVSDQLHGVYASHVQAFAIAFALPISPDKSGVCQWHLDFDGDYPCIKIANGYLDEERVGYLFRVPIQSFRQIDQYQWISDSPVTPVDYAVINPRDYLDWVGSVQSGS